jgi:cell wall-associated NlpC family hydrolase
MTTYRGAYPLPRRYRRVRYRHRLRSRKNDSGTLPVALIAGAVLLAGAGAGANAVVHRAHPAPATGNRAAAEVVAFARSKVGKVPYAYGGTTDAGMDCSGLAMNAYASAGVSIERTSQEQWASEQHVSVPVAGDLVFFAGSDGTPSSPGHVGIVVDPARHTMIDAYATGTYVRYDGYGSAASPGTGLGAVVGYTDPAPQARASPVTVTAPGPGEAGFIAAVLAGLGAPDTTADVGSLKAWVRHETSWPPVAKWNPMNTTLTAPGSTAYNHLPGGGSVQNYPTAADGVQATAATLLGGYPLIVVALRSGTGICGGGFGAELSTWSGGGYQEVC